MKLASATILTMLTCAGAQATDGYFSNGFGARNSALAGAGVADSTDAMSLSINPAGLVDVGRQFNGSITLFAPFREYSASGTIFVAPGTVESDQNLFAIPSMAYSHPLGPDSALGVAFYGNGGMNTTYRNVTNTSVSCPGAPGVFCAGKTGVDLIQAFLSVGYAHRFDNFSIGVAPIFAVQAFKANGLGAFIPFSSNGAKLTNRDYDLSWGFGARIGAQFKVTEAISLGLSYQSKIYMSEFDEYAGLFANGGDFDIPANLTVGIAIDATPDLKFLLDYKRIFYGDIGAISNPSTTPLPLGVNGGPGFGWRDINIYKFGVEWQQNDKWTWRAGYSYNTNPVRSRDVTFNILAPGVSQHHITGGFTYKYNDKSALDFAVLFSPRTHVSGAEMTSLGPTAGSNIDLSMSQFAVTVGWTHKW